MKLSIPKDYFDGSPTPPRLFLCTPSGKIINELIATGVNIHAKWNSYSEISFETPMCYVDILTGETKIHPMYAKVESPRQIYAENIGFFILQDIDDTSGDNDIKSVTAFSSEYAVANKYLTSFYINTGEVGSREVTYNENNYGIDYSSDKDSFYKLASGAYDPYESYYVKKYTSTTDYVYEQTQIDAVAYAEYIDKNNDTLAQPHEKLYMKKFANVQFYHQTKPGLSLLHLALEVVPDWKIGHVDATLWHKERTFSQDRISVYDFLMNDVAETFGCIFEWNTITKTLNVYEEAEDGIEEDNAIQTRWATDVFISKDNLASEVQVKYSADNIKTKLTVTGGEDLNIREVNLDRNEIMNLSFYHTLDWMEQDLFDAYNKYLDALKEAETGLDFYGLPSRKFPMAHSDAVQKWVAAQNKYNDLMHTVPVENDTVLIGDEFKKLYCTYTPIDTAFSDKTISPTDQTVKSLGTLYFDPERTIPIVEPTLSDGAMFIVQGYIYTYNSADGTFKYNGDAATTTSLAALIKKLNQYHVDDDINGNKTDNVLLKLKNANGDVATIRIYDPKKQYSGNYNPDKTYYKIKVSASGVASYEKLNIADANEFTKYDKNSLYTNNYTIQSVVVMADSGLSGNPSYWSMEDWDGDDNITPKSFSDWVKGNLTAQEMGLVDENGNSTFTISYIGTMGAYFVLAKNEFEVKNVGSYELIPSKDYLRQYGVNLLKEKHDIYTTIFQTQTEAMFSQEGYQCTVGDNAPTGTMADGTRWLDTNSVPVELKSYDLATNSWKTISASLSPAEQANYENYQRYIDNYQKLQAVQEVLAEKEREAEYCLSGHSVPDRMIDICLYTRYVDDNKDGKIDDKDFLRYNGALLEGNMHRAAEAHFAELSVITGKKYSITRVGINENLPLYTFTTSYDPIIYGPNTEAFNPSAQYYAHPTRLIHSVNTEDFDANTQYYVKSTSTIANNIVVYNPVNIADKETFDLYDGTTEDKTLYVATKQVNLLAYAPVEIADEETFNEYNSSSEDKILYVIKSGHVYAVYLRGTTPYVAYADSMGVYQMIRDYIRNETEMNKFFTEDQWIRISPFIREDEFSDQNFFWTDYDSEEQKIQVMEELMKAANKELNTLCQPSLEFSMTMANILALPEFSMTMANTLALPEFSPLITQFQLGNFIRVQIRDGYIKRARLLEVNLNFDDLSDFSCTFGNLVTTKSEIDKHAELLAQAVSAGKQVAVAASTWQRSSDKVNKLEEAIEDGLQDAALQVGRASGQAITWDANGFYCRKFVDGTTDQYEDEQMAIINNKIVFTNDGWKTSEAALGEFQVDTNGDGKAETLYGLIAKAVVSGYIKGSIIEGGSLKIGGTGGTFIVNEDGSVQILGPDAQTPVYATKDEIDLVSQANQYHIELEYTGSTIFTEPGQSCVIKCRVFNYGQEITTFPTGTQFKWIRNSNVDDTAWNNSHTYTDINTITITNADVEKNAQFSCQCTIDETKLS